MKGANQTSICFEQKEIKVVENKGTVASQEAYCFFLIDVHNKNEVSFIEDQRWKQVLRDGLGEGNLLKSR